jgi:hypothetical protein
VKRDRVGGAEQLVVCRRLHPGLADPVGRHDRVVGDHVPPERARPRRHRRADPPEPDDPEPATRRSVDRRQAVVDGEPVKLSPEARHLRETPRRRQEQQHGVIGDLVDAVVGHVRDPDARIGRRRDVDHVVADAGPDQQSGRPERGDLCGSEGHHADDDHREPGPAPRRLRWRCPLGQGLDRGACLAQTLDPRRE